MNASDLPDETLFESALKCRTPAARAAYLDQVCSGQPALRLRIEALLKAHDGSRDFLEAPAAARPTVKLDLAPEEQPGTAIGRYKLLQKIGEGGMGAVYMAEQTEPVIRRVALKIIKLGMDTHQVVARFEAERQALALMDHPNIAKVLDAGATETGRPYFVMELVHGVPVTQYCDKNKLSTTERIELFIPVCQAIQHAHQKGIIHRDIKPTNVMVTLHDGVPVPKVIDFGVAKATNQRLTEKTLFTNYAQMIGTPAYMSPEQAEMSGLDIDTRSDVYSLGVLLYELLTGTTPFDAKELLSKGYAEMQRIIVEREPLKPSTRMSTLQDDERTVVAKNRRIEATALRRGLQGDLDWIVMKCLEKDRQRRYETANGLAADLRRHLDSEVITARPPSRLYEFQKTVRRHKFGFAATAAIIIVLVAGIVASTWQAVRANRLLEELRSTAPAFADQARALVAESKFDAAIEKLQYAVQLSPEEPEYYVRKANLLQCQLRLSEAVEAYRAALKIQPGHQRAKANLLLSEELLASQSATSGKPSLKILNKLLGAMQAEQRSAAELILVSQLAGGEKSVLLAYWLERLRDLPISGDRPLEKRLVLDETGRFFCYLDRSPITDLNLLVGMPIRHLDLERCDQLTDFSPLREMQLESLRLDRTGVVDLSFLNGMTNLTTLYLNNSRVNDLSPLQGKPLRTLQLAHCPVTDISPLRGMPLKELRMHGAKVASLAPLQGMALTVLDCCFIQAEDYEHLARLPLEYLHVQRSRVRDLGFLSGMPLKNLSLWGSLHARNFGVLSGLKTLEEVILPADCLKLPETEQAAIDALEQLPKLDQITDEEQVGDTRHPKENFWSRWKANRALPRRLTAAGLQFSIDRRARDDVSLTISTPTFSDLRVLEGATINELSLRGTSVSDLSPLHQLPLKVLNFGNTRVQNLEPLRGLALTDLALFDTPVADISPLQGMPLEYLHLAGTKVTDLAAIQGMPLKLLTLDRTEVQDVSPIAKIESLEQLMVSMSATNLDLLRKLPNLRLLSHWWDYQLHRPNAAPEVFWRIRDKMMHAVPEFWHRYLETDFAMWGNEDEIVLQMNNRSFRDLSLLKGAPIDSLRLGETQVSDLRPLQGMPLTGLWLHNTQVNDLRPLAGMPLRDLNIDGCPVRDLSPLRGMPLLEFYMERTLVTDLSPLLELPLGFLRLNEFARGIAQLNRIPTLTELVIPPNAPHLAELSLLTNIKNLSHEWRGSPGDASSKATLSVDDFWKEKFAKDTGLPLEIAALQAWHGQNDRHMATCRKALVMAAGTSDLLRAERTAKACSLKPISDPAMQKAALELARYVVNSAEPDAESIPWFLMSLGMAEYRNGHFAAAAETLAQSPKVDRFNSPLVASISAFYRAMSLHQLGQVDAARMSFAAATERMKPLPADESNPLADGGDHNDLILWMAYREAAALLGVPQPNKP